MLSLSGTQLHSFTDEGKGINPITFISLYLFVVWILILSVLFNSIWFKKNDYLGASFVKIGITSNFHQAYMGNLDTVLLTWDAVLNHLKEASFSHNLLNYYIFGRSSYT